MPSVYSLAVTMTGAAGSRSYQTPKTSPPYQFLNVVNMTDNVLYLCGPQGQSIADAIYTFGAYATLSIPISPEIALSFQFFWTATTDFNLVKKAQISFTYDSLNYNQSYASSFAYNSGSLIMSITGNPTVNANIQGVANVAIQGTPQVDITGQTIVANVSNAGFQSDVINAKLATNDLILIANNQQYVSVLSNNTIALPSWSGLLISQLKEVGVYDGMVIYFISNQNKSYDLTLFSTYTNRLVNDYILGFFDGNIIYTGITGRITRNNQMVHKIGPIFFESRAFNDINITIKNISGSDIVDDNITAYFYGIKSGISNPASVPVNMIFGQGSYDTTNSIGIGCPGGFALTSLLPAGNYIKKLRLSIENNFSTNGTYNLMNGSNQLYTELTHAANTVKQVDIDLGSGIYNSGLGLYNRGTNSISVNGTIITSAQTPNSKVSTIV